MRRFAALISLLALSPAAAEVPVWTPVSDYITHGQDEAGYHAWYRADPSRASQVSAYYAFLQSQGVGNIVPTWQLLRTASNWQNCAAQPFEVPPANLWPHIVETLRYIRANVVPEIGPVEPVSVYRDPALNACAHGASESAHQDLSAIDLVALQPTTREGLIEALCAVHEWRGQQYSNGIGFYVGLRFHVDSRSFRSWATDQNGVKSSCAAPTVPPTDTPPLALPVTPITATAK